MADVTEPNDWVGRRPSSPPAGSAAAALESVAGEVADQVVNRLYQERPELLERYGNQGLMKCREDVLYNVEYLVPAVELGESRLFIRYVEWLVPMLAARDVPPGEVRRSLEIMVDVALELLGPKHGATVAAHLRAGLAAVDKSEQ